MNSKGEQPDDEYVATPEELQFIDAAMAAIDSGEFATDDEVEAAFAKFSSTVKLAAPQAPALKRSD